MQLDQTHVVIRVRTLSEIGDLALVMIRRYPTALSIGFFAGALPWVLINAALLTWIPVNEMEFGFGDGQAAAELWRYLTWMMLLVVMQTPIAGVLTTIFLGQAVFEHQPTWRSVFVEGRRQFWRWFWTLGVKRLVVPAVIVLALRYGQPANGFFDVFVPLVLLITTAVIRSSRPFLPEIILLEQCALRSKQQQGISAKRRSRALHAPIGGELSGRYVAVSFVLFFLMLSVYYTLFWFRGIAFGVWHHDLLALTVFYPLALWLVAGLSVIVRLLSYLDTRIRLEGWEVELAIRAEAIRQFGEDAGWLSRDQNAQHRQTPVKPSRTAHTSSAASEADLADGRAPAGNTVTAVETTS